MNVRCQKLFALACASPVPTCVPPKMPSLGPLLSAEQGGLCAPEFDFRDLSPVPLRPRVYLESMSDAGPAESVVAGAKVKRELDSARAAYVELLLQLMRTSVFKGVHGFEDEKAIPRDVTITDEHVTAFRESCWPALCTRFREMLCHDTLAYDGLEKLRQSAAGVIFSAQELKKCVPGTPKYERDMEMVFACKVAFDFTLRRVEARWKQYAIAVALLKRVLIQVDIAYDHEGGFYRTELPDVSRHFDPKWLLFEDEGRFTGPSAAAVTAAEDGVEE